MPQSRIRIVKSIAELRACRTAWDELWRRSGISSPLAACEPVACWLESFAADARFRAVVVEEGERFVAALPLVDFAPKRWLRASGLTGNDWSGSGALLIDSGKLAKPAEAGQVSRHLLQGLKQLEWPLQWFEAIPLDSRAWQALQAEVAKQGVPHLAQDKYQVNTIDLSNGWEEYAASQLSKNARKQLRRDERRLSEVGQIGVASWSFHAGAPAGKLPAALQEAFDVEHRSWKGPAGTSVLATPGMLDFFLASARSVAEIAEVQVHLLTLDDRPIAFQFGYLADRTFHIHKIGYDDAFAEFSPGHLLRQRVLQFLAAGSSTTRIDCLGPRNAASDRWATDCYRIGRLILSPHGVRGRMLLLGYKILRPGVRMLRSLRGAMSQTSIAAE